MTTINPLMDGWATGGMTTAPLANYFADAYPTTQIPAGTPPSSSYTTSTGSMPNVFNIYGYPTSPTGTSGDSTSTTAPWTEAQPYILDLMARGQTLSQQPGVSQGMTNAYSGMSGVVNNGLQQSANTAVQNILNSNPMNMYGMSYQNPYATQTAAQASNPFLGQNNPYLTSAINTASQTAMDKLTGMFAAQNKASGSFGNSGLAEAQAQTAANTLGGIATNAYMQDYATQQGLMQNQAQFNAGQKNAQNQFNAGLANQTQGMLNSQYNMGYNALNNAAFNTPGFNAANMSNYGTLYNTAANMQNAQWQPLMNYGSLLGSGYGTTTSANSYSNPWLTGLGAIGIGSSLYNNIFGGG